jgi:hypothetical protein
LILLVP